MAKVRRTKDQAPDLSQTPTATADNDPRERIAARAYELYLARGGADGQDWEDWLAAERELADHLSRSEPAE